MSFRDDRPHPLLSLSHRTVSSLTALSVLALCGLLAIACDRTSGPDYTAGEVYFGRNEYIEYLAGDLPIILSAPHGGTLIPAEIPDRTWGTMSRDLNTEELARKFAETVHAATGGWPHVVICRLRRTKLDANRDLEEAAQGNRYAEQAWNEWHRFLRYARKRVESEWGAGFYIDLHGHGHPIQRLELGYLLSDSAMNLADGVLDGSYYVENASVRELVSRSGRTLSDLLRGPLSLGTLLEERDFPAVPSQNQPYPAADPYFTGGYNTATHSSRNGGTVSGVQIECNYEGVRDSSTNRAAFAAALTEALEVYLEEHFGLVLQPSGFSLALVGTDSPR